MQDSGRDRALSPKRPGYFLQFFTGTKHGNAVGTNRYDFSGLGITGAISPLSGTDFKGAEPPQLDNFVLTQAVLHFFEELVENIVNIFPVYTKPFIDILDNLGFRQLVSRQIIPSVTGVAAGLPTRRLER